MTNTSDGLFVAWYRCAVDGREHAVTDEDFSTGMRHGSGRYRSLCGHQVTMDTTLAEPAPECVRCGNIVVAQERAAPSEDRGGRIASRMSRRSHAALAAFFAPRRPLRGDR